MAGGAAAGPGMGEDGRAPVFMFAARPRGAPNNVM